LVGLYADRLLVAWCDFGVVVTPGSFALGSGNCTADHADRLIDVRAIDACISQHHRERFV